MKVQVYLNRVKINYAPEFEKAKAYFKKHGLDVEFSFATTDLKDLKPQVRQLPQGERITLLPVNTRLPATNADVVMFVFNAEEFSKKLMPTGQCYTTPKPYIDISTHSLNVANYTYVEICHEMMHALCCLANQKGIFVQDIMDSYRENFNPDSPTGNFAQQWVLLQPYLNKQIMYKYFSPKEVAKFKLKPELWTLLDKIRGECGFPFIITSGLRSEAENKALNGSVSDSAHLSGLAVDLSITDSLKRFKLIDISLKNGIKRIGVGKTFIHIDIDSSKPQNVSWLYD